MKDNFSRDRQRRCGWVVTLLISFVAGSCTLELTNQIECGPGTTLRNGRCVVDGCDATRIRCAPGEAFDLETCQCLGLCDQLICNLPLPVGWADATPVELSDGSCVCRATTCLEGYVSEGDRCVPDLVCPLPNNMIREGSTCVFDESQFCTDVWWARGEDNPLCTPRDCDTYGVAIDGTDLDVLGLCLQDPGPPGSRGCRTCHGPIEDPHPWFGGNDLTCTACHGGNAETTILESAHVPIPSAWQTGSPEWGRPNLRHYWNYLTLFGVERFAGGLEWLRFRNPSDLRIAEQTCGSRSGCHQDRVLHSQRGIMATAAGLVDAAQAGSGIARSALREGEAIYKYDSTAGMTLGRASLDALVAAERFAGSVAAISEFSTTDRENLESFTQVDVLREIYDKQCGHCHLGGAGRNDRYGDFRTSGCGACHMPYAADGRSQSGDAMIRKGEPLYPAAYTQIANYDDDDPDNARGVWLGPQRAHPVRHEMTTQMSSKSCAPCHSDSNQTFLQYMGVQTDPNRVYQTALELEVLRPDQVRFSSLIDNASDPFARYRGLAQDQLIEFLDLNDDGIDDIAPDIHYVAGLECIDCHTSAEMHNQLKIVKVEQVTDWSDPAQVEDLSGALWSRMDQATEIECVHCHGTLEHRARSFEGDNRNPVKNLFTCPEEGESIGVPAPSICNTLGRGRFLRSKITGNFHYVPQTHDTVNQAGVNPNGVIHPESGEPIYTRNASIFHGRYQADNDPTDGIGPCAGGVPNDCFQDQATRQFPITEGFSHLGRTSSSAVDQAQAGLECYGCHATWANACFGCHLRIVDRDDTQLRRQHAPSTGQLTLGEIFEADVTAIPALDLQYGINSEGKIAQLLPSTKQFVALTDRQQNSFFGTQITVSGDPSIQYNVYRHRDGYGLRRFTTEAAGLSPDSDGPQFEQLAAMDLNAGQGANPMMPHTVQRSSPLMDCETCHLNTTQSNRDRILARWMARPTGFAGVSDYLSVVEQIGGVRRLNSSFVWGDSVGIAGLGYRFDAETDPSGFSVPQQSDYCVYLNIDGLNSAPDGFTFCYNNHPMRSRPGDVYRSPAIDPEYARDYPALGHTSGPLNADLLNRILGRVFTTNEGVEFRDER